MYPNNFRAAGDPTGQLVYLNMPSIPRRTTYHGTIVCSRSHQSYPSSQHVKYGSNLMNLFLFLGGPGEPYVESRGTKLF